MLPWSQRRLTLQQKAVFVTTTFLFGFVIYTYSTHSFDNAVQQQTVYPVPSNKWMSEQMEIAYKAMESTYQPPTDWTKCISIFTNYFPNINIIFTGIPKTGCSNWEEALLRAEGALNKTIGYVAVVQVLRLRKVINYH